MIEELKKIREELLKAIDNNDLLYAMMIVNRLDTVIYNANKVNENDLCPDVRITLKCKCENAQFTRVVDNDNNPTCGRCGGTI